MPYGNIIFSHMSLKLHHWKSRCYYKHLDNSAPFGPLLLEPAQCLCKPDAPIQLVLTIGHWGFEWDRPHPSIPMPASGAALTGKGSNPGASELQLPCVGNLPLVSSFGVAIGLPGLLSAAPPCQLRGLWAMGGGRNCHLPEQPQSHRAGSQAPATRAMPSQGFVSRPLH